MPAVRTFTQNVSLPAGTPAGLRVVKTILDSEFEKSPGFAVYTNIDGGVPSYQVGLRDDTAVYASLTNAIFFGASLDCPKNQRLTLCEIPCTGRNLTIEVNLVAPLANELNFDVVFSLEGGRGAR